MILESINLIETRIAEVNAKIVQASSTPTKQKIEQAALANEDPRLTEL